MTTIRESMRVSHEYRSAARATPHRIAGGLASSIGRARALAENACYRPICVDALPLMGGIAGVSGTAMAELIADGESTTVDLRPFTPARLSLPLRARN